MQRYTKNQKQNFLQRFQESKNPKNQKCFQKDSKYSENLKNLNKNKKLESSFKSKNQQTRIKLKHCTLSLGCHTKSGQGFGGF
ncbi:hypothetical protein BBW65_04105 [Helicobacter enhydrae]|uniref:Uncharacterized protein n=1 Tax=Helicobacter enhydrae TaxID=222136 RepID=A0A1B1U5G0_9HELI|nr:hypothetical protein BBW65_04105 [Helicobacter enhydrae]